MNLGQVKRDMGLPAVFILDKFARDVRVVQECKLIGAALQFLGNTGVRV